MGAELYTRDTSLGVISFNLPGRDSGEIADKLAEADIAVRGGLHCAPLAHRSLGTQNRGAVRASIGADTTERDIYTFAARLEAISARLRRSDALNRTR